jgi:hypothetical protein
MKNLTDKIDNFTMKAFPNNSTKRQQFKDVIDKHKT